VNALHLSTRRLMVLLVLAALVALAAGATTYLRPVRYAAHSTVFVARVLPNGTNIDSSVADFETAMRLPEVENTVASQTGVSAAALHSGLGFSRIGASTSVDVSFTSTSQAQASNVVTAAAHQSLLFLAGQQVSAANDQVAGAQKAADSAAADLAALNQKYGVTDIDAEYQTQQQDLLNLDSQLATTSDPTRLAAIQALISQKTTQVTVLAGAHPQWQQVDNQLLQAQTTLNDVQATVTDAQSKLSAAGSPSILTAANLTRQGRLVPVLRLALGSAVVLLILGTGLFLVVDLLAARRRRLADQASGYEPGEELPYRDDVLPGRGRPGAATATGRDTTGVVGGDSADPVPEGAPIQARY
jgi:hypothetical protein